MAPDGRVQLTAAERRVLRALEHDLRRGVLAPEPDHGRHRGRDPGGADGEGPTGPVARSAASPAARTGAACRAARRTVHRTTRRGAAAVRSAWYRPLPGYAVAAAGLAGTAVGLGVAALALRWGDVPRPMAAGYLLASVVAALALGATVEPLSAGLRRAARRFDRTGGDRRAPGRVDPPATRPGDTGPAQATTGAGRWRLRRFLRRRQ